MCFCSVFQMLIPLAPRVNFTSFVLGNLRPLCMNPDLPARLHTATNGRWKTCIFFFIIRMNWLFFFFCPFHWNHPKSWSWEDHKSHLRGLTQAHSVLIQTLPAILSSAACRLRKACTLHCSSAFTCPWTKSQRVEGGRRRAHAAALAPIFCRSISVRSV